MPIVQKGKLRLRAVGEVPVWVAHALLSWLLCCGEALHLHGLTLQSYFSTEGVLLSSSRTKVTLIFLASGWVFRAPLKRGRTGPA